MQFRLTHISLLGSSTGIILRVAGVLGTLRLIGEHQTLGRPFSGLAINHFIKGRTKCVVHCSSQLNHRGSSFPLFLREQEGYSSLHILTIFLP